MEINKSENQPLVSVIVPSYNHERFIIECIESIVNQTYKNIELTVIDDGSKENSPKILKELQTKYGFNLVFQENHGIAYTLNRGINEFSKGKYITFCASDDFWLLDKVEKQVEFMENHIEYPMCYGKTHYIDGNSNIIKKYDIINNSLKGGRIFEDIFTFKIHPPVNYMFRREIFDIVGRYDEKNNAEDYYLNLKISSKFSIGYINEYLSFYRYTESSTKLDGFEKIANAHLLSIEGFQYHPLYSKAKKIVYLTIFIIYSMYSKHKIKAVENLFKSIYFYSNKDFWYSVIKLIIYWKK